ncbi:MAG: thiamine-phosphate kinase [Proteobacteria bacterium]|nr:thiamine-phosphate kinase [Pseudomonadota bacterium]
MQRKQSGTLSAEERLIARHFAPLATHPGAFGLRDDAAAIAPPAGCDLVLTSDGVIAGVHFFPDDPADLIAKKALRMNLSDLAAKGAAPLGFLMALALTPAVTDQWLADFSRGLGEDARLFACPLLGGDTDRTPGPLSVSMSAVGTLPCGTMVRRDGARAGDRVVVTGTIGDAALGLLLRRDSLAARRWNIDDHACRELHTRYLLPQPRNAIAEIVRTHASAAMDISDGLAGDVAKLCRACALDAEIDVARVPLSAAVRAALAGDAELINRVLCGGDDYEVLATVAPTQFAGFARAVADKGVALTEIGVMVAGPGEARIRDSRGELIAFENPSFSHF